MRGVRKRRGGVFPPARENNFGNWKTCHNQAGVNDTTWTAGMAGDRTHRGRNKGAATAATAAAARVLVHVLVGAAFLTLSSADQDSSPAPVGQDDPLAYEAFNTSGQQHGGGVVWQSRRPNIIVIMADDLGWNDVGWNPYSSVKTPTLARLASKGVILSNAYSLPKCAPSRLAFMTGRHPLHSGFQATNVRPDQPIGAPLDTPLISDVMKKLGYKTHLVGKWHLGFCNWSYTPTERGFDSFFGFYGGSTDHYLHSKGWSNMFGYDLRSDKKDAHVQYKNRFSSHIFTKRALKIIRSHDRSHPLFMVAMMSAPHAPMQVPWRYRRQYKRETQEGWSARETTYAAMVTAVDTAVGKIVSTLRKNKMMDNSIIIFTSDNGGYRPSSNYPLRGTKSTQFEGGTRVPTMVFSPLLQKKGYVNTNLFHITDWLPTLVSVAGGRLQDIPSTVDGIDASQSLITGAPSPRQQIVYNVEKMDKHEYRGAIRDKRWKLIRGNWQKIRGGWADDLDILRRSQHPIPLHSVYNPAGAPWNTSFFYTLMAHQAGLSDLSGPFWIGKAPYYLFDLQDDPCERNNLLHYRGAHDAEFSRLLTQLHMYSEVTRDDVVKKTKPTRRANPSLFGGVWSPGWC